MSTEKTVVETVPNPQLAAIIVANQLPADLGNVIQEKFSGAFAQLDEWKAKSDGLVIEDETQTDKISLANEGRKTLMKIRTSLEKTRVELKAPYLNMGRAIDAVCKSLTERIEPIEQDLKTKAEYVESLARARKETLIANRRAALIEVGHSGEVPGLGDMPQDTFQMILEGAKVQAKRSLELALQEQAMREALGRLQLLVSQIVTLGATCGDDGSYSLGNAKVALDPQGVSVEKAEEVAGMFRAEKARLENREKLGRDRRESLLKYGLDIAWDQLADLSQEDWDTNHDTHRQHWEDAKRRAELGRSRTQTLLHIGAKIVEGDIRLGTALTCEHELAESNDIAWDDIHDQFQSEAKRIKDEAEAEIAAKELATARKMELVSMGAKEVPHAGGYDESSGLTLDGCSLYELGDAKINTEGLEESSDEEWAKIVSAFEGEAARIKAEAEELERKKTRAANRLIALTELGAKRKLGSSNNDIALGSCVMLEGEFMDMDDEEWECTLRDFTEEAEEIREKEAEILKARERRMEVGNHRLSDLHVQGWAGKAYSIAALAEMPDQEWLALLALAQEQKMLRERNEGRKQSLFALGATWVGKFQLGKVSATAKEVEDADVKEWPHIFDRFNQEKIALASAEKKAIEDAAIAKQKQEAEAAAKAAEEAAAKSSDKEKWQALQDRILNVQVPHFKAKGSNDKAAIVRKRLEEIVAEIELFIK